MSDLKRKAAYVLAAAKERIKNNFNEGENMSDLFNSVCITSVAPTVSLAFGMNAVGTDSEDPVLSALIEKKLFGRSLRRAFVYGARQERPKERSAFPLENIGSAF